MHTYVPDEKNPKDSHAWITVEKEGKKQDYSLYPPGVLEGQDKTRKPTASLYKNLNPEQELRLKNTLAERREYSTRNNNCSHFTKEVYEQTTSVRLPNNTVLPDGVGGNQQVGTPIGLEQSIRGREIDQQTEFRQVVERPEIRREPTRVQHQQTPEKLQFKRDTPREQEKGPSQEKPKAPEKAREPEKLVFKRDTGKDHSRDR